MNKRDMNKNEHKWNKSKNSQNPSRVLPSLKKTCRKIQIMIRPCYSSSRLPHHVYLPHERRTQCALGEENGPWRVRSVLERKKENEFSRNSFLDFGSTRVRSGFHSIQCSGFNRGMSQSPIIVLNWANQNTSRAVTERRISKEPITDHGFNLSPIKMRLEPLQKEGSPKDRNLQSWWGEEFIPVGHVARPVAIDCMQLQK